MTVLETEQSIVKVDGEVIGEVFGEVVSEVVVKRDRGRSRQEKPLKETKQWGRPRQIREPVAKRPRGRPSNIREPKNQEDLCNGLKRIWQIALSTSLRIPSISRNTMSISSSQSWRQGKPRRCMTTFHYQC